MGTHNTHFCGEVRKIYTLALIKHHINDSLTMKKTEQSDHHILSHKLEHGHLDIHTMFHEYLCLA